MSKRQCTPAQLRALAKGRRIRAANLRKKRKAAGQPRRKPRRNTAKSRAKTQPKRRRTRKPSINRYKRVNPPLYNFNKYA